ncbi:MAG: mannitol dehydrogenase family protein [Succinivibrio sp.]|nr:mannitol dehydrogenase family protein [Succinivibrio sp.]
MMKVTLEGIRKDKDAFKKAGVALPAYDIEASRQEALKNPVWVHMGAGNIFRGFIASLQERLLADGLQKSGITTVTIHKSETIEKICRPHDGLVMNVTLMPDKRTELEVLGSLAYDLEFDGENAQDEKVLREMFRNPSLQMLSFTITEKGYALKDIDGNYTALASGDFIAGPSKPKHGMAIVAALLYERYQAGKYPMAVVSMDNCSHNGEKLKLSVLDVAEHWLKNGLVEQGFIDYLNDGSTLSFPCTMIDKITPRPDPEIAKMLADKGIEGMEPIKNSRGTYIAPFVNAEKPQYLVIEDKFPNGRPQLEKVGVLFTDLKGVDLSERMKVTTCLNPLHTALAVYGCILGYTRISQEVEDKDLVNLIETLGYKEGLPVCEDPKVLSPKAFLDEVIKERLPNKCLPDSPQRIATDSSLKVPVRFGETLKNYKKLAYDTSKLVALPLALAGWLRYLMAVDDNGRAIELSDDPQLPEIKKHMTGIEFGHPESVGDKLRPLLSNKALFGVDLYDSGINIGDKVVELFCREIAGAGAVRKTLKECLPQ